MSEGKPVRRRDEEGRWPVGRSGETLIDRQIREAMEKGKFDNLPHQGAPLPNDENPHAGEWGLAFRMLRNAGYAPPWIEADKEIRDLLARREALHARAAGNPPTEAQRRRDHDVLEKLVREMNVAIARLNSEAPSERQHRRFLVLADELAWYDEAADGGPTRP